VAHPLSEVLSQLGFAALSAKVHDSTAPYREDEYPPCQGAVEALLTASTASAFYEAARLTYLTEPSGSIKDGIVRRRAVRALRAYSALFRSMFLEFVLFLRISRSLRLFKSFLVAHARANYYLNAADAPICRSPAFFMVKERDRQRIWTMGTKEFPRIKQTLCAMVPDSRGRSEEVIWERLVNSPMSTIGQVYATREMMWSRECDIVLNQLLHG